ncbi:MAG: type III pantothenate kinase [Clostridia bacterium]|nr:type III pantothenate kinase [Clostridia bacterium]
MLLTLDLGNTNLTIGVFNGEELACECRLKTDRSRTGDQYAVELLSILKLHDVDPKAIHGAILSSVVPGLDAVLCTAVQRIIGVEPLMVGPGIKTGMNIRIDNPAQLGADLLVGAVAAVHKYGTPCIVWDLGTATTVSAIDASGAFRGGAIMPGVATSLDSLVSNASLLQRVHIKAPEHAIGTNTSDSMRSGAVLGTASMMEGMCDRIEQELGVKATVVVTGGLGREIAAACRRETVYDDRLLLDGLRLIYEKNRA